MSEIHFYQEGDGQPLILIHGFCETGEMWRGFSASLGSSNSVYAIDLPGFGMSPLDSDRITLEEVAVQIEEWMHDQDIKNPIIIGHSLGGYVALSLLELLGNHIKGIGLFNSTSFADPEKKKAMRNKALSFIEKKGVAKFVDSFVPQLFPENRRKELAKQIQVAVKDAHRSSLNGLLAYTQAMRDRPDRSSILAHFQGKKLMIAGTKDSAVPIEDSRKQKELFTHYHELEGMGHMGMIEEKEKTLNLLQSFLKACKA